jgi:ABC-type sugar transport system ATPase subunit
VLDARPQEETGIDRAVGGAEVVVRGVSKTYDSRIVAVRDASLRLAPGEFVSLTGPSGCGKSTLLNLIGSLARPDSGSISVDGIEVTGLDSPAAYRRSTVGFVFQLHYLLPMLTAGSNVEVPLIGNSLAASAASGHGSCSPRWVSPAASITFRRSCPAASASAWRWRARWPTALACCWRTSRPARSTPRAACACSTCSRACAGATG